MRWPVFHILLCANHKSPCQGNLLYFTAMMCLLSQEMANQRLYRMPYFKKSSAAPRIHYLAPNDSSILMC